MLGKIFFRVTVTWYFKVCDNIPCLLQKEKKEESNSHPPGKMK